MIEATIGPDKEMKKRQTAMQNRLKKLGTDNPVVQTAVKKNQPKRDTYKEFEVVNELVSAAYSTYSEKGDLKQVMKDLAGAILKASGSADSKAFDEGEDAGL